MKKIYEKGENYVINKEKVVKCTQYDSTDDIDIELIMNGDDNFSHIRKLSKDEFFNIETGEVCKYNHYKEKNIESLKKSMKKLEGILRNNFSGSKNELFITLTTKKNISDVEVVKKMFNCFWKKLKQEYSNLEYVYVVELQENRGGWHIHALIKDTKSNKLYISNETIEKFWNEGYTKTNRITDSIENKRINEEEHMSYIQNEIERVGIESVIRYMTKTKSKEMIPSSSKVYYKSRNIKIPISSKISYESACTLLKEDDYVLKNEYTVLIKDEETNKLVGMKKRELWKKRKMKT